MPAARILGYSQKDTEIIYAKGGNLLAIRIENYTFVWDVLDLNFYVLDSADFAYLRDKVNLYCSTVEEFLSYDRDFSSFVKEVLKANFLSKMYIPVVTKFSLNHKIEYPTNNPSISVNIYYSSEESLEEYNEYYIEILKEGESYFFEVTPFNKINYMPCTRHLNFLHTATESVTILPDKCRELLKSFIDSGAYNYMLPSTESHTLRSFSGVSYSETRYFN